MTNPPNPPNPPRRHKITVAEARGLLNRRPPGLRVRAAIVDACSCARGEPDAAAKALFTRSVLTLGRPNLR